MKLAKIRLLHTKKMKNENENGYKLEIYVEKLYYDLGKLNVKRNVQYNIKKIFSKELIKKIQVDVQFFDLKGTNIVECKYLSSGAVNDDDVNKLRKNTEYLGNDNGILVTNKDFSENAVRLAGKYEIKLISGNELRKMDYDRSLFSYIQGKFGKRADLEKQLKGISLSKYSNEPVIKTKYVI